MAEPLAASTQPEAPRRWSVLDTTCVSTPPPNAAPGTKALPRVHEHLFDDGVRSYEFYFGKRLEMTEAEARKFVMHESFHVFNTDGDRVLPTITVFRGFGDTTEKLADNECVARFDELTIEALHERAAPLPGGEHINRKTGKAGIIAFLISSRKKKLNQNRSAETREVGGDVDDLDPRDVARMMELEMGNSAGHG